MNPSLDQRQHSAQSAAYLKSHLRATPRFTSGNQSPREPSTSTSVKVEKKLPRPKSGYRRHSGILDRAALLRSRPSSASAIRISSRSPPLGNDCKDLSRANPETCCSREEVDYESSKPSNIVTRLRETTRSQSKTSMHSTLSQSSSIAFSDDLETEDLENYVEQLKLDVKVIYKLLEELNYQRLPNDQVLDVAHVTKCLDTLDPKDLEATLPRQVQQIFERYPAARTRFQCLESKKQLELVFVTALTELLETCLPGSIDPTTKRSAQVPSTSIYSSCLDPFFGLVRRAENFQTRLKEMQEKADHYASEAETRRKELTQAYAEVELYRDALRAKLQSTGKGGLSRAQYQIIQSMLNSRTSALDEIHAQYSTQIDELQQQLRAAQAQEAATLEQNNQLQEQLNDEVEKRTQNERKQRDERVCEKEKLEEEKNEREKAERQVEELKKKQQQTSKSKLVIEKQAQEYEKSLHAQQEQCRKLNQQLQTLRATLKSTQIKHQQDVKQQQENLSQKQQQLLQNYEQLSQDHQQLKEAHFDITQTHHKLTKDYDLLDHECTQVRQKHEQLTHTLESLQDQLKQESQKKLKLEEANSTLEHEITRQEEAVVHKASKHQQQIQELEQKYEHRQQDQLQQLEIERERANHASKQAKTLTEELETANLCLAERRRQRDKEIQSYEQRISKLVEENTQFRSRRSSSTLSEEFVRRYDLCKQLKERAEEKVKESQETIRQLTLEKQQAFSQMQQLMDKITQLTQQQEHSSQVFSTKLNNIKQAAENSDSLEQQITNLTKQNDHQHRELRKYENQQAEFHENQTLMKQIILLLNKRLNHQVQALGICSNQQTLQQLRMKGATLSKPEAVTAAEWKQVQVKWSKLKDQLDDEDWQLIHMKSRLEELQEHHQPITNSTSSKKQRRPKSASPFTDAIHRGKSTVQVAHGLKQEDSFVRALQKEMQTMKQSYEEKLLKLQVEVDNTNQSTANLVKEHDVILQEEQRTSKLLIQRLNQKCQLLQMQRNELAEKGKVELDYLKQYQTEPTPQKQHYLLQKWLQHRLQILQAPDRT